MVKARYRSAVTALAANAKDPEDLEETREQADVAFAMRNVTAGIMAVGVETGRKFWKPLLKLEDPCTLEGALRDRIAEMEQLALLQEKVWGVEGEEE